MPVKNETAYEVVWLIRRLFRAMAAAADDYLADAGISVAERAVLEFLHADEALSVPAIARRYNVSRQHVQVTVNSLIEKGLVRRVANPKHKRSHLIRLSRLGRDAFREIRRNEAAIVGELFADIDEPGLRATRQTLGTLLEKLK